jgi:hypothetical protein
VIAVKNVRSFGQFALIVTIADFDVIAKNDDKKHAQNYAQESC